MIESLKKSVRAHHAPTQRVETIFLVRALKRLPHKRNRQAQYLGEWIEEELNRRAECAMAGTAH